MRLENYNFSLSREQAFSSPKKREIRFPDLFGGKTSPRCFTRLKLKYPLN